jgi:hypothetical protein
MSTFDDFVVKLNNQPCEVEDPTQPDQCMDLAFAWCDAIGVDRAAIRHEFAYQVWTQPNDLTVKFFEYVPNTPNGVPPQGALVVFNENVGVAGHISIATGKGDSNSFDSFDQNWSGAAYCKVVTHAYTSVYGWLVKRAPAPTDPILIGQSDAFIAVATALNTPANKDLVIAEINKLITIEDQATDKDKSIADLNKQIGVISTQLGTLKEDHDTLTGQIMTQAKTIQDQDLQIQSLDAQLTTLKEAAQVPVKTGWQLIADGIKQIFRGG